MPSIAPLLFFEGRPTIFLFCAETAHWIFFLVLSSRSVMVVAGNLFFLISTTWSYVRSGHTYCILTRQNFGAVPTFPHNPLPYDINYNPSRLTLIYQVWVYRNSVPIILLFHWELPPNFSAGPFPISHFYSTCVIYFPCSSCWLTLLSLETAFHNSSFFPIHSYCLFRDL